MTPVFADTFFFLALLNGKDSSHERAREGNRVNRPIVTSEWVLIELADHLCDERNRHLYGKVLDALREDGRYEIVRADPAVFDAATAMYRNRHDKSWSLTDCTSFVLMQQRGIVEALTGDQHFSQAGFRPLLN